VAIERDNELNIDEKQNVRRVLIQTTIERHKNGIDLGLSLPSANGMKRKNARKDIASKSRTKIKNEAT